MSKLRVFSGAVVAGLVLSACVEAGAPPVRTYVHAVLDGDFETARSKVCPQALGLLGANSKEMMLNLGRVLASQQFKGPVSVDMKRGDSDEGWFVLYDRSRERLGKLKIAKGVPCPEGSLLGKFSSW